MPQKRIIENIWLTFEFLWMLKYCSIVSILNSIVFISLGFGISPISIILSPENYKLPWSLYFTIEAGKIPPIKICFVLYPKLTPDNITKYINSGNPKVSVCIINASSP